MRISRYLVLISLAGMLLFSLASTAAVNVDCVEGCASRGDNRTVNLLVLEDSADSIVLEWVSDASPAKDDHFVQLYAGNPLLADVIPSQGAVEFTEEDGLWKHTRRFNVSELGRGTFLAILVRDEGSNEQILDWRSFRLLRESERDKQKKIEITGGNWSVDLQPVLLQVKSGHGELPYSTGGDDRVWWPMQGGEGDVSDADIDGENNGVAGIGVQVSTPWQAREGWRNKLISNLSGVEGHVSKFGELIWNEVPDRELRIGADNVRIDVRHYYSVVTLHTNASVKVISERDLGKRGRKRYFTHETSAALKPAIHPRFWASYSRREYSADNTLLELLQNQNQGSTVPGLAAIQTVDGDGGSAVYRVGIAAAVRPWELESVAAPAGFIAGFVGLDVVAARAGLGAVRTAASADDSSQLVCNIIRCDS